MRGTATFSVDGTCRFVLVREWGNTPPVVWIGCNPSDADGERDDPTIRRCIGFTERFGYRSLIMLNIYPWISSAPKVIAKALRDARGHERFDEIAPVLAKNAALVTDIVCRKPAPALVIAAWGRAADIDIYTQHFIADLLDRGVALHCLGLTKDGDPIHPMARGVHRVPDDAKPVVWKRREVTTSC